MGCRYELLSIDDIVLDKDNPRIALCLEMYPGEITENEFKLALGSGARREGEQVGPSYNTLKRSIESNKGIIHPILVSPLPDGKFLVIEGNTRVLIYKEFKKDEVPGDWSRIPAMIYDEMDSATRDAIRLQAHLVGTREWDPYSKAKYLHSLRTKKHLTHAQIVDFCGGNSREVENYIQAYKDMEEHYRAVLKDEGDFDASRFSAFVELQASRVQETLVTHKISKTDFARWVHEKKIYPLNTVRSLPRIFSNPKAKEAFLKYGATEAIKLIDSAPQGEEVSKATLVQLARELIKKINALQWEDQKRLKSADSEDREILHDAYDSLEELWEAIKPQA